LPVLKLPEPAGATRIHGGEGGAAHCGLRLDSPADVLCRVRPAVASGLSLQARNLFHTCDVSDSDPGPTDKFNFELRFAAAHTQ
jgi:hypothetical protein